MLAEAPKWMDTERFDILAKAAAAEGAGTPMPLAPGRDVQDDSSNSLLRTA
jgi:hypothetical protein